MSQQQEMRITPKIMTANGYIKNAFSTNYAPGKDKKSEIINVIKGKIKAGKYEFGIIYKELLEEKLVSNEKHNIERIPYLARSSLGNYVKIARDELGVSYVFGKDKILGMFDAGKTRKEIHIETGYSTEYIYAKLIESNRISKKYKKG